MSHELLEGLYELGEIICEVRVGGKTCVGALFKNWKDAFSFCRTGSFDWIDSHPPSIVKLHRGEVKIDGIDYTVVLYWSEVPAVERVPDAVPIVVSKDHLVFRG